MRGERARGLPHLLRLDGEDDERRAGDRFARACRMERDAGEPRRELRPRLRIGFDHPEIGRDGAARQHAADEGGRHVAASDEGRRHR